MQKMEDQREAVRDSRGAVAWLQMREQQKATLEEIKAGKEAHHERE